MTTLPMNRLLFILAFIFAVNCFGQEQDKFIINEYIKVDSLPKLNRSQFKVDKSKIFEDSTYVVSKSCSGEWGGTIRFKNKKNNIDYSSASTCPVALTKLNGKYYVTNTLAHLAGFSEIIEINNPDSLAIFKLPKPRKKGEIIIRHVGDDESKSTKGTKQLVDSLGVLTIATFPYQGQLYHVLTDFRKTVLTKIIDRKFVTIDTISIDSLWTYEPEVFTTNDKHYIVFFDKDNAKGYLDIFANKIKIVRQK